MKANTINPMNSEMADTNDTAPSDAWPSPITKILDSIQFGRPISMKSAFFIVLGLHLLAVVGVLAFSIPSSAQADQLAEDKKYVLENAPMVGVEIPEPANPKTFAPKKAAPKPKVIVRVPAKPHPDYPQFAKEYVVQKGDTFSKIVKKYRLDAARLKALNGIKDENKLMAGQKLKLF